MGIQVLCHCIVQAENPNAPLFFISFTLSSYAQVHEVDKRLFCYANHMVQWHESVLQGEEEGADAGGVGQSAENALIRMNTNCQGANNTVVYNTRRMAT